MLLTRARTFALRDTFPHILLGLGYSVEELQDIPADHASSGAAKISMPPSEPPPDQPGPTETPPPKPATTFSVKVPYGGEPAMYPRTRGGAKEAFKEIVAEFNDGYHDVVALNL